MNRKVLFVLSVILLLGVASVSFAALQHQGVPWLDDLSFKVIKTEDATVDALLIGEVEMMGGPGKLENIDKVVAAGYNQTWDPSASYGFGAIICWDVFPPEAGDLAGQPTAPLNDPNFRKAMLYVFGMDRKATSVLEYYGGPQTYAASQIIPDAQAYWFFGDELPFPDTDVDAAWAILEGAGYYVSGGVLYNPDDTVMRDIEVLYSAGALSWEKIAGDLVKYMNEFFDYIGATTSPAWTLTAKDFNVLVYDQLLVSHNYDIIFIGLTGLGPNPDWCVDMFHSKNIGAWGWNFVGLDDPYVDGLMDIIWSELDMEVIRQACYDWQEYFLELVPHFPMTNTMAIATYHPDLDGFISTKCFGSVQNEIQFTTMHWTGSAIPGGLLKRGLGDEPTNLHPWYENTLYGWLMMDMTFGTGAVTYEPTELKVVPWIAYAYEFEPWSKPGIGVTEGMMIEFRLRNDITWHDGTPFTAHDAKFHLDMFMKYKPERYSLMWDSLIYAETDGDYIVRAFYNGTSPWQLLNVAGIMRAPKQIWSIVDQMVEDGTLATIMDFDVQTPYEDVTGKAPPAEYPYMKAGLVGIGPYVWDYYDESLMVGEVHKYEDYWIQSPVEAAVDCYFRVDPDGSLDYEIVLLNTAAIDPETTETLQGSHITSATVDVKIYVDDALVEEIAGTTIRFNDIETLGSFNTGSLAKGTHTIKAEVYEGGELIDTYVHTIAATIREDLNLDGQVNIMDVAMIGVAWGSVAIPYHPRWDPRADMDGNYVINILDVAKIAVKFGWGK